MTEQQVVEMVATVLEIPANQLTPDSRGEDFEQWDSMGTLAVLAELDRHGLRFDPGDVQPISTMKGIIRAFRQAGKLQ